MKINKQLRESLKKQLIEQIRKPGPRDVTIKTTYKLSSDELKDLTNLVPQLSEVKISNEVDKSILGGMVIVDGSKIIDFSVRGRLNDIIGVIHES